MVSPKALLTHPQGLSGVYGEVLQFIPRHCSLLLEITQARGDQTAGVTGFDFLVNAVWPEIVATVDTKASVIFAPGNPDTFHKVHLARCSLLIQLAFSSYLLVLLCEAVLCLPLCVELHSKHGVCVFL